MKWLALTFGGASTHYRVHQYVPLLQELGIELVCRPAAELSCMMDLAEFDGILLQKKLLSWSKRRRVAKTGLPVVFDIDDATWQPLNKQHHFLTRWRTNHRLSACLKLCKHGLAANAYIAEHLQRDLDSVEVLPMTLPLRDWAPVPRSQGPVVVGWAGAPGNHFQLRSIEPALRELKRVMPEVVVRIFSGVRPDMDLAFDFVPFDAEQQIAVLHTFSIGLLPLPDTPFNHGKSPIKALQYMAAGIPCVASPLAGTVEMLGEQGGGVYAQDMDGWTQQLLRLSRDTVLRESMGRQNRARFEAQFTAEAVAVRLAAVLRQSTHPDS